MGNNGEKWQVHGRGMRILCDDRGGAFDQKITGTARTLVRTAVDQLIERGKPVTKQALAQRLGVSRNRIPRLLEVLDIQLPEGPAGKGEGRA